MSSIVSTTTDHALTLKSKTPHPTLYWDGADQSIAYDSAGVRANLLDFKKPIYFILGSNGIGASTEGTASLDGPRAALAGILPAFPPEALGDAACRKEDRKSTRLNSSH